MTFVGGIAMQEPVGILTALLKIIRWLREETERNSLSWEMRQSGMAEVSVRNYTFRLIAAEMEIPQEGKIEVPGAGKGRAFAVRRFTQIFVLQGDNLLIHAASFMHPVLESELASLADVVISQIAARNEERLRRLLTDLGLTS
jgi:hypothetical protein